MSEPKKSTGMLIDGVFASEAIDSSGEIVSIDGMDITTLEEGHGVANYEHLGEDGNYGREVVGKIVFAKKIRKESDCENDRQRLYWKKLDGIAFLYGVVRLYDGAGHEGAKALAAQIRDHVANDEPILVRYSIEGTTTKKNKNKIEGCIARKVALTLKPCNKTCDSGLISDPNAPDGFPSVKKFEAHFVDPEFAPLGGSTEVECNPCLDRKAEASLSLLAATIALTAVSKAMSAGNYDAAPGTLTGGAALQREDFIGSNVKAALRDYGWHKPFKRNDFKTFAKAKMPEVSDEFLDHFADIAEAYSVKKSVNEALAKKDPSQKKPKAAKTPAKAPAVIIPPQHQAVNHAEHPVLEDLPASHEDLPDEMVHVGGGRSRNIQGGTYRGKALKVNPGLTRPTFDAKKGVLHTPIGSFKAYLPKHDGPEADANYQKILSHPDIENAMDTALTNWTKVHKLLKAGKLPPEVVMHAVMFSQLSPNKPVPTQEIQYARLVDAMDATGLDPREPGFGEIAEPYHNLDHPTRLPHTARDEFARNPSYYNGGIVGPNHNAQGQRVDANGRPATPSLATGRMPGDLLSGQPLFEDFLSRATQYHKIHDGIVGLVNKHRANGFDAVAELMDQKRAAQNAKNVRRAAVKAGKPDPGEFQGISVPGVKVKTGLYTWGMLGNGDSLVPDTHEVRNLYGLDLEKDSPTIDYLKQLHWRPTNMENVMRPLNDWYLRNHPAVQYTLNHPKWGSSFERPQDALFPAFWRHWLTIQPHEKFLGLPNMSEQAGTTHAPYWQTISPYVEDALKKHDHDCSVPLRTALVHQQYVKDYGEMPAMFLFFHHLAPKLIEAAEHRKRFGSDMKFLAKARALEAGLIELRKSIQEVTADPEMPEVHAVQIHVNGKKHPAGRFMIHGNHLHHLEDYHGILSSMLPEGEVDATTISRLHGLKWSPKLTTARSYPETPPEEKTHEVSVVAEPKPRPKSVFQYHRPGMLTPHVVEFGTSGAALDGKALSDAELGLMLDNARKGIATIRYQRVQSPDRPLDGTLMKSDAMDMEDVIRHMRAAEALGHLPVGTSDAATKHAMEDSLTDANIGNKYAYTKFMGRKVPGVYLSMDANSFKSVNDTFGHTAGDEAIKGMGKALRTASDRVGTGKLFRPGGDEFVAHFPSYEDASKFMRHATGHLNEIPPIAGVHKLSMSFGIGNNFEDADKALYHAKSQKLDPASGRSMFHPTKTPHLAHSLVPGTEGPVKLHTEAPPAAAMPKPQAQPTQAA